MKNSIYLRRKNKISIYQGTAEQPNLPYIATILKNIEDLGYTISPDIIDILKTYSKNELGDFYLTFYPILKEIVGAHREYRPMYPNFPHQVMKMADCELYFNSFIHYISNGILLPNSESGERLPLVQSADLRLIDLGTEQDFFQMFVSLMQAKRSISQTDKQDLVWFFNNYEQQAIKAIPNEIPFKENVALIMSILINLNTDFKYDAYVKTATDVLRIAVSMSDGDISLASNTRFISFKRRHRKMLLGLLENCSNIEEDMVRHKKRFIRLAEKLHPSEYKRLYPKAEIAFNKLRNNIKITTFNSAVNQAINNRDYTKVISLLSCRPGEFARRLDFLLRAIPDNNQELLTGFHTIAPKVSVPVLLQVKEHFANRNVKKVLRTFFPKGNVAKAYGIVNNMLPISEEICAQVVDICNIVLITLFSARKSLGKVYINENLKDYLVPFSQRSASKALKTFTRGTKIDIPENTNVLRAFIYWKEQKLNRTDIDLSAVMYDSNWSYVDHISYTNLKSDMYQACHSGDIVSAPNGASEFIDVNLSSLKKNGIRYVVYSLMLFTLQTYVELPECFMGFMAREDDISGEIYEPKTVQNKMDLTSDTSICIPMILDIEDQKIIWCDLALKKYPNLYNNVESNAKGLVLMGKAMQNLVKPNLYDLFSLHTKARGQLCNSIKEADTVFSLNNGVTPYDIEIILSEYL